LITVPRKTKTAENKSQPSSEPGPPVLSKKTDKRQGERRTAAAKKPRKLTSVKETAPAQISTSPKAEQATSAALSEDTIRLRAYFISERRRRFGLPGDTESDWLEAKRQLLAEKRR
jgi:Protein of unknown function (DUF2934)